MSQAVIRGLEVITICVPPALPTALSAGILLSINRLSLKQISCIKPDKVNVGGVVTICGFDKTGTLTESGLAVFGCKPVKDNGFGKRCNIDGLGDINSSFFHCLASCHTISYINNELMGDPLDLRMFEATNLKISGSQVIGAQKDFTIDILKRYDFISELQRMSVIVEHSGSKY